MSLFHCDSVWRQVGEGTRSWVPESHSVSLADEVPLCFGCTTWKLWHPQGPLWGTDAKIASFANVSSWTKVPSTPVRTSPGSLRKLQRYGNMWSSHVPGKRRHWMWVTRSHSQRWPITTVPTFSFRLEMRRALGPESGRVFLCIRGQKAFHNKPALGEMFAQQLRELPCMGKCMVCSVTWSGLEPSSLVLANSMTVDKSQNSLCLSFLISTMRTMGLIS